MASVSVEIYGERVATAASEYWVAKLTHLFQIWAASGEPRHVMTDAEINSWAEPADFTAIFSELDGAGRVKHRLERLQALRPAAPR